MTGGRRRWAVWLLAGYVVVMVVLLLAPISPGALVTWATQQVRALTGSPAVREGWVEFAANVALFVPPAFLLALVPRRFGRGVVVALLCAVAASVAVEAFQLAMPGRAATLRDVAANVLGALIGVVIAAVVDGFLRRGQNETQEAAPSHPTG